MKGFKLILLLLITYTSQAQLKRTVIATPMNYTNVVIDTFAIKPTDTTGSKILGRIVLHPNGTLFRSDGSKFLPVTGGGGAAEVTTGTIAQLRALTTGTGKVYTSTDGGGGSWVDIGLSDGQYTDDGATYIITSNNHVLRENTFYTKKEIDLKKFGLPCDGSFHSIASLLPKVTLSQVQAIDATATLSNSADWYIVSMLLKTLPIQSTIIISGAIVIDKKITIKRGAFEIKGINSAVADKFENFKAKIVQIGNGQDVFYVTDGDGTTYGYGVGQVNNVKFTNILIEGTMTATNQSGNGFSLNLSPDAISGTAVNWSFADVSVRSCLNGFKHVTGHVNDFFFDHCDFSINFNAGFVISGDSHNQANYFNFKNTSFNSNGFMVQGGSVVDYVQDTAAPNYTKGGLITTQVVALSLNGISAQVNRGYGIDLGTGSHLGVFITGYAEANQLGDLRVLGDTSHNINVIAAGMYSRDQTFVFEDESVKKRVLLGTGSDQWKALGSYITNTNPGNTGIGTIPAFPPSEKLDIASLNGLTKLRVGYASSGNGVTLGWNNNSGRSELNTTSNFPLELGVNGQRQIAIKSSGIVMGTTPVSTGLTPPANGLLVDGAVSSARATQPNEVLRKDQFDSAYAASAFTLRGALGTGYSLFNSPNASTGIVKQVMFLGTNYPVIAENDSTLFLDFSDFAHLSTTQTFTGNKTFSAPTIFSAQPTITYALANTPIFANASMLSIDNSSGQIQKIAINKFLNSSAVLPEFTGNAAAIDAGYSNGDFYRTGDVVKQVHP